MLKGKNRNIGWQVDNSTVPPIMKKVRPPTVEEIVAAAKNRRQAFDDYEMSPKQERQSQQKRIKERLREAFPPDGRVPIDYSLKAIAEALRPLFVRDSLPSPKPDSIARALGRRKKIR
jgi:hypothetical protein